MSVNLNYTDKSPYYLLSWMNITHEELEAADRLPNKQQRRRINKLVGAFVKTLPDVTGHILAQLRIAGGEPKFIQNPYAMGITFKRGDTAKVIEELIKDPHTMLMDASKELYEDPDSFFEKQWGQPQSGGLVVGRMNIGTITPNQ